MKVFKFPRILPSVPVEFLLCTSAEEFKRTQQALGYRDPPEIEAWVIGPLVAASTHYYDGHVIICCELNAEDDYLVHEAVHVVQAVFDSIGENAAGREVWAYSVQYVFKSLRDELNRRKAKCETN